MTPKLENAGTQDLQEKTRMRLLESAGEVFAERGFQLATVRDICSRADANIAAISYHFGDKKRLYSEVLRHWYQAAVQKYPPTRGVTATTSAPKRLHAFIESFLLRILDKGKPAWFGKLLAQEMIAPTHALDERIEENVRPMWKMLLSILGEISGGALSEDDLRRMGMSIVGQIVFHHHARQIIRRVMPQQKYEHADIEELARHITTVSLAGLRALKRNGGST